MSITKSRLLQIIKEEVEQVREGWGGRGGRYRGGDTTGYRGSYSDTPWYRQGGSGRMSDAEARERGARGYDEPYEKEAPRGPRGGLVHSSVSIYVDPDLAAEMNRNLAEKLDDAARVFIDQTGYDGMAGKLILGKNPTTGFYDVGERWVLSKSDGGYTFTIGAVTGSGASPSDALADAAMQGFEGSDVVLGSLGAGGMGSMEPLDESRWGRLAGVLKD